MVTTCHDTWHYDIFDFYSYVTKIEYWFWSLKKRYMTLRYCGIDDVSFSNRFNTQLSNVLRYIIYIAFTSDA